MSGIGWPFVPFKPPSPIEPVVVGSTADTRLGKGVTMT